MMNVTKTTEFRSRFPIAVTGWLAVAGAAVVFAADDGVEAHNRLVEYVQRDGSGAVPALIAALDDDRAIIRMTAARLLASVGVEHASAVEAALRSTCHQVRRTMIGALVENNRLDGYWTEILLDDHPAIKRHVLHDVLPRHPLPTGDRLAAIIDRMALEYANAEGDQRRQMLDVWAILSPLTESAKRIVNEAASDADVDMRESAYNALAVHADRDWEGIAALLDVALEDESAGVRARGLELKWKLLQVHVMRLPDAGWRFRTDPDGRGRSEQWYGVGHDDGRWRSDVPIEISWQNHMDGENYYGTAWYRRSIEFPDVADWDRALLDFSGVDEEGWVWLNGKFAGEHTQGLEGWDLPFQLDVTDKVKPGADNQLTVKVNATRGGAGIWRPVHLRLLDTRRLMDENR